MRTATALTVFILLALQAIGAAPLRPWMPMAAGSVWNYRVTGAKDKAMTIQVVGRQTDRYDLKWGGKPAQARVGPDGVVFMVQRPVGVAAKLEMVPLSDLRWNGSDHWQATTKSGCMGCNIECTREKMESVTVPAGTYNCVKIVNRTNGEDDVYWIAQGVGVVKRLYQIGDQHIEWQLVSFKAGK